MGPAISKFVFRPPDCTYGENYPYQVTWLTTPTKKKIPAYFVPSTNPEEKRTIIYSHGNSCDMGDGLKFLILLRDQFNYNVFAYDYLGYGLTKEKETPSEAHTYESARTAFKYVEDRLKIPQEKIILFGTSLGTGVTIYLASRYRRVRGVILESPFESILRTVFGELLFAYRMCDMFESYLRIGAVTCPVFIIHGVEDEVVPVEHGVSIYKACKSKYRPIWVENAGHNNIRSTLGFTKYFEEVERFLNTVFANRATLESKITLDEENPEEQKLLAETYNSDEEEEEADGQKNPEANSFVTEYEEYL